MEVHPDLWFFKCHFQNDPVMPGCLGVDAMWQMAGFFLGWLGGLGKGRALGVGEVKFSGMVLPSAKLVSYYIEFKRVIMRRLVVGIADGIMKVDGKVIYEAKDLRSACSDDERSPARSRPSAQACRQFPPRRNASADVAERSLRRQLPPAGPEDEERRIVHEARRRHAAWASCLPSATTRRKSSRRCAKQDPASARPTTTKTIGFRCQVHGSLKVDLEALVDRRARRFMGDGAAYSFDRDGTGDARFRPGRERHRQPRTGLIMGSGGPSTKAIVAAADTARNRAPKRVGPFAVPKAMSSTCSANLSTWYKTKGVNYSISSACSTSANCIGNAAEMIQWGKQDIDVRRRRRRTRLDAFGAVRRDGRDVVEIQRDAGESFARFRQEPRRLRDLGRRRRAGARRA